MADVDSLLRRARAYAASRGIALTTVSKRLFGDWRRIDAVAAGKAFLRPPTLTAALERMAELEAHPIARRTRKPRAPSTAEPGAAP